ncbi:MAG: ComF family protein [Clostridia bacterium]|nr:ComF family protein [Clostridia bacterium]
MRQTRAEKLISVLFPARCALCGRVVAPERRLCADCLSEAEPIAGETCPRCAMPKKRCSCGKRVHFYDEAIGAYIYDGVVKEGVLRYKKNGDRRAAYFFSEAAAAKYREKCLSYADYIAYIPQRRNETRERGFDQARELAALLSENLNIPLFDGMVKLYDVPPQKTLSHHYKRGNVAGIFDISTPEIVGGKTFLLFDDVKTTGETLEECAKMLKLYGAQRVVALTFAVTEKKRRPDPEKGSKQEM